jgi:carboxyl-terminal processing protease
MPKRNILWMLAVVAVALGTAWLMKHTPKSQRQLEVRPDAMVEAYNQIIEKHYPPVDPLEIKRNAIAAMVKSLDPQSVYIPYELADAFEKRMQGQTLGTGLVLDLSDRGPIIACVDPNSPADRAGLLAGDLVTLINSKPTFNMNLAQVNELLSNPKDGKIELSLIPSRGSGDLREVTLELAEYPVEAATGLYRDKDNRWVYTVDRDKHLVYIKVSEFVSEAVERFKTAFRSPSRMGGLVLDLRGNPGGYLSEGVALANLFLHDEPIVTVLGNGSDPEKYVAHPEGAYPPKPLVVLIDSDTASAAEIVAGSLKAADRAILLGMPTRGKHSVQTPIRLGGKLGLMHLTTARFYFPEKSPEATTRPAEDVLPASAGKPITPHLFVSADSNNAHKLRMLRRRAASAFVAPASLPATMPAGGMGEALGRDLIKYDPQLAEAIKLLRDPDRMEKILQDSADARKKRLATQPGGKGALITP